MLNQIIQLSLRYRLMVVCAALAVMVIGTVITATLPIDVLPDLTRPRVVLMTEAHGMSPEEIEQQVTFPLERALIGASGVIAVRSTSDIGYSVIYVEFDWGTSIYLARQIVQERITVELENLPPGARPQMGPISSLLGQIMLVGMWSETGETGPLEVRTQADWVVRQRLLAIPGVAQVMTMGGGRKQFQVLVDLHLMHQHEVELHEIEQALVNSNLNVTGGYVERGAQEWLVRGIGRLTTAEDIRQVPIRQTRERPVLIRDVAVVQEGAQVKRGDSSINGREAVVLTIQKQPSVDTRELTTKINAALNDLRGSLPTDVVMQPTYEQREFIDHSVENVIEALRDGAILVVIVLFIFLLNFRTTFITLTAIPLSIVVTAIVFRWFEMSINVMTLGGIAVAMGELVDDAIVDVENIFRRLKENAKLAMPRNPLTVIYEASVEVRGAIIISTILVIVVFAPLFALSGMEGRLFTPLGIAYLVSICASTVISLTVTPVLSSYLLPKAKATHRGDGWVLRKLKATATPVIRFGLHRGGITVVLVGVATSVLLSGVLAWQMGRDFLPPFDEGAIQVNLYAQPGTSLATSTELSQIADAQFQTLVRTPDNPDGPIRWFTCRTGRAEQDEHAMGVHISEYIMTLHADSPYSRAELIARIHELAAEVPGVESEVEQPIAHLISHMLSGVTAQIAVKIYGDDLDVLRSTANQAKLALEEIPGIAPPIVEPQTIIPQYRIEVKRDALARYGVSASYVHEMVETALNGRVVTQLYEGQRSFDVLLRLAEPYRSDLENLDRFPLELPDGRRIPLSAVAHVYPGGGPNTINRDDGRRRIVVRANTMGRDLGSVVTDVERVMKHEVTMPEGYFVVLGGQFEAQRQASQRILLLSVVALMVAFVVLYTVYPSTPVVLQILIALPTAFVGGVLALWLSGQTMSIAAMVGFISLGGIAARNGLLLVSTYLDRIPEEGFKHETIVLGSLDRLAPVLMTALTTGLALVPLVIGGNQPGKEILLPVATVILGGLVTSTLCEFLLRPGLFWLWTPRGFRKERDALETEERPLS